MVSRFHAIRSRLRLGGKFRTWRHRLGLEPTRTAIYLARPFRYPADSIIGQAIARGGAWDPILRTVAETLLPSTAPTICEVGSNIGASTLQLLRAKPRASIYAFEPSDRYRSLLEQNVAAAGTNLVQVSPILLGRESGRRWLSNNTTSASVVPAEYDGHDRRGRQLVEMSTLDAALASVGSIEMIKVDTDGYDFEVLRGAKGILGQHRPVLFFELATGLLESPEADLRWLQSLGYRRLACFRPSPQTFIGMTSDPRQAMEWAADGATYCDVLACCDHTAAAARLAEIDLTLPDWNPGAARIAFDNAR